MRKWPLLWKILLAVSIGVSLLVGASCWLAFRFAFTATTRGLEDEVTASLRAYETLWQARENMLASVSMLMSSMPDVRASFRTGDRATIRDTAAEVWAKVSRESAFFLVSDPAGVVLASLGGVDSLPLEDVVRAATPRFPLQSKGFLSHAGKLWQIVVTPVYVDAQNGPVLIDVLLTGYPINQPLATALRKNTGSEFDFSANSKPIASTLSSDKLALLGNSSPIGAAPALIDVGGAAFGLLTTPLLDIAGNPIAQLRILRSFDAAQERLKELQRGLLLLWAAAVLLGLALSYALARKIVGPIERLDKAATEVARRNYDTRLQLDRDDELGRLALTFNNMCASIQEARSELIRQERLATIGQFATSIVHDLRNPLAAIYGGAEMLVDTGLTESQIRRLARNIYSASRGIQALLQDLTNISRGKTAAPELCPLASIVCAATECLALEAASRSIALRVDVALDLMVSAERARLERVFHNLISNSLEAIQSEGAIHITCEVADAIVVVRIADSGPGIDERIQARLFEPFATAGKRNGLGLGLALSRQAVRSHGGELWQQPAVSGACFCVKLPVAA